MNEDWLSEQINSICYKLDHYNFTSKEEKDKLFKKLQELVEERDKLRKNTIKKKI
jgi:hypothetical protein